MVRGRNAATCHQQGKREQANEMRRTVTSPASSTHFASMVRHRLASLSSPPSNPCYPLHTQCSWRLVGHQDYDAANMLCVPSVHQRVPRLDNIYT